ncbi:MAG: CHAD domain-containing protein [Limisphaerales bacterium]
MLERELKLLIARKDLAKVFKVKSVIDALRAEPERKLVQSSYFDTPEQDLRKGGIELRVRQIGRQWIQTLKVADKGSIGMHAREEFEDPVAGGNPDFSKWADADMPSILLSPEVQDRVEKIFETRFWRRKGMLDHVDGTSIEICVDSGAATAGEQSARISEVELELKQGEPAALYEVAEALTNQVDLRLNALKKPDLGYRLINEFEPAPVFAKTTDLSGKQTVEDMFVHLLTASLEHAFANEEVVLDSSDIEGVHQMRVGLRRFRSALGVFKHVIPAPCRDSAKQTVKPLLAALGPARDWDVFITEQIALMRKSLPHADQIDRLEQVAESLRARAYQHLRELMRTREYHQAKLALFSWLVGRRWRQGMTPEQLSGLERPARAFARRALKRGQRRVRRRGCGIRLQTLEQLHALRIATKRQRYSVEFFASLFPANKVAAYRSVLKEMQTDLGLLNDGVTAKRLLGEIGCVSGMQDSVEFVLGWMARGRLDARDHLRDVWKAFKSQKPFWKKRLKRSQR